MNQNTRRLLFILLAIILALFLVGLLFRWINWQSEEKNQNNVFRARTLVIKPETENISLMLPGFLVAYNITPILSRTNGYLKDFYHDIGDIVRKNELLCEIDTPDVEAELKEARAEYEKSIAARDIAKVTAQRWTGLYSEDSQSIAKQQVDVTSAELENAIAAVNAAEAHVQRLQVLYDFRNIMAPFDGIIVERNIDIGSLISIGTDNMTIPYTTGYTTVSQPLFRIAKIDVMRIFVDVPQPYYSYIEDGVEAQVRIPEHPHRVFKGTIVRNAVGLDQSSRTLLTQINIPNEDLILRPGLYSEVNFSFKPKENTFTIPVGALIIRNGPPMIATVDQNDVVTMHQVEIGKDNGKTIQIVKGLEAGERIILNPNYRIRNGLKVSIIDEGLAKSDDQKK